MFPLSCGQQDIISDWDLLYNILSATSVFYHSCLFPFMQSNCLGDFNSATEWEMVELTYIKKFQPISEDLNKQEGF